MYHQVEDDARRAAAPDRLSVARSRFERQMERLRRGGWEVLPLGAAVARLRAGDGRPAVAVTFDDGYEDLLETAVPCLRALAIPATIFVVERLLVSGEEVPWSRGRGWRSLSLEAARALAAGGAIEIGAHTTTHPLLTRQGPRRAGDEVVGAKARLERLLGRAVRHLAWPDGRNGPRERRLARAAGYEAACAIRPGTNLPGADLFRLRRTEIAGDDDEDDFEAKLRGGWDAIHAAWQWVQGRG
jgi:peptidoglycan/xylan/chitin deacetylase (PgdA/CDA1 family)